MAFVVLSAVLAIHGCRANAVPSGESVAPAPSATKPKAAAGIQVDGGASPGQPRRSVIASVLEHCAGQLALTTFTKDIHEDDALPREQATFLDRDLKVPALRRRSGVAFANVIQPVDGKRAHVGIIELTFRNCKDLDAAFAAMGKVGRATFNVAALSVFRVLRRESALVILFSETPFHPRVRTLLETATQQVPGTPRCEMKGP